MCTETSYFTTGSQIPKNYDYSRVDPVAIVEKKEQEMAEVKFKRNV